MNGIKIVTSLKKRSGASNASDDHSSEADSPKPRQGPPGLYSVSKLEERWDRIGRHLVTTASPVFVFIAIWLLWFGITSPVPSRRLGPSLMAIDSHGAAKRLARAVGGASEDFAPFPTDTGCGIWFGSMGSCAREPNGPLVCQAPSVDPDYTSSVIFLNDTIPLAEGLISVINVLPNAVKALPVVPSGVFIAAFCSVFVGFIISIIGNIPRMGSEQIAIGRIFNRFPGIWSFKMWCMYKNGSRGRLIESIGVFFLFMGWVLGFSGTVCMQAQWSSVAPLFNQAYAGFLSQMAAAGVSPPLLSAHLGSALPMQWACWALTGLAIAFSFLGTEHYPDVLQPFEHGQAGGAEDYGMSMSHSPFGGLSFPTMPMAPAPAGGAGKGAGLGLV